MLIACCLQNFQYDKVHTFNGLVSKSCNNKVQNAICLLSKLAIETYCTYLITRHVYIIF